MNKFKELKLNVEALFLAVSTEKKFFAAIYSFVDKLHNLMVQGSGDAKKEELLFLAQKIENFFKEYRPTSDDYFPPAEAYQNDGTVREIHRLAQELTGLSDDEFNDIKPAGTTDRKRNATQIKEQCIFIGHGRNKLWVRLNSFLKDELGLKTVSYESEPRAGESIVPILEKMLNQATFAILVLTAEEQSKDGMRRARQNVIHEAGLFQGKLGFDKAILLVQKGLEGFTNVDGLQHIKFSDEDIEEAFYRLQETLKAKGLTKK